MKSTTATIYYGMVLLCVMVPLIPLQAQTVESVGPDKGDYCISPVPPEIGYRPSLFECNGNAAILLRGDVRKAYSVVLRRNGFRNDRGRENPECSLASCSPFKVQKRIELPAYRVNCLGDNGFGVELGLANRIAIKFQAAVSNARDPEQYQQYCLKTKKSSIN